MNTWAIQTNQGTDSLHRQGVNYDSNWGNQRVKLSPCSWMRGFECDRTNSIILNELSSLLKSVILSISETTANTHVFDSGTPTVFHDDGNKSLFEIRRLSGLNWDQIAEMLAVDRRSVHNWAAGKPMALKNRQRLGSLLAALRYIDRGSARATGNLLLSPALAGQTFLQLAASGRYEEMMSRAGEGIGRAKQRRLPIEPESVPYASGHFGRELEAAGNDSIGEVVVTSRPNYRRIRARRK
jgi:hypothetical protein